MAQWRDDRQLLAHYCEILAEGTPKIPFDGMSRSTAYARFLSEMRSEYYAEPLALAVSTAVRIRRLKPAVKNALNCLILELENRLSRRMQEICEIFKEVPPDSLQPLVTRHLDEIAPFNIQEVLSLLRAQDESLYEIVRGKMSFS